MIHARAKSCLDPEDLSTAKWTVEGVKTDGHTPTMTTEPVNSTFVGDYFTFTTTNIPLRAEREEDGRGQSRIGVKITLSTDQYSDNVTIKQTKGTNEDGEGVFNVIRQEYEDVKIGGDDIPQVFLPGAGEFSRGTKNIDHVSGEGGQFPAEGPTLESYVAKQSIINEIRTSAEDGRDTTVSADSRCSGSGDVPFKQCMDSDQNFYHVNSHYRPPAYNKTISSVAQNPHMEGEAFDFDWRQGTSGDFFQPYDLFYATTSRGDITVKEGLKRWLEDNLDYERMYPHDDHLHLQWVPAWNVRNNQ